MAKHATAELFAPPFSLVCKGVRLAKPLQKASHCETNSGYLQIDDQREDAATCELPSALLLVAGGSFTMRFCLSVPHMEVCCGMYIWRRHQSLLLQRLCAYTRQGQNHIMMLVSFLHTAALPMSIMICTVCSTQSERTLGCV